MRVTVIDYGIGNLYSVRRAFETSGADVTLTSDGAGIADAERLVLPGVGAFSVGMAGLGERGLVEPIREYAASGRPLLGICLGMQMFATTSQEFGEHPGLGLIPGSVVAIPSSTVDGSPHKIPHIAWTALHRPAHAGWNDSPLQSTAPGTPVYLVHSYHVVPDAVAHVVAECEYGGHQLTAAVRSGKVFGCQFHPEKSGPAGLEIVSRFLAW